MVADALARLAGTREEIVARLGAAGYGPDRAGVAAWLSETTGRDIAVVAGEAIETDDAFVTWFVPLPAPVREVAR